MPDRIDGPADAVEPARSGPPHHGRVVEPGIEELGGRDQAVLAAGDGGDPRMG